MIFKKTKDELEFLKNDNKSKALQITALLRENDKLKIRLQKIESAAKNFDHINGNPFCLINQIRNEANYE